MKIAVIGLGYVGLPLCVALARKFDVVGFDIDASRVAEIAAGHDRTGEISEPNLHSMEERYRLTPDYMTFNKGIILDQENDATTGVSAMSLSDMTNIPRATVIRKCKYLMRHGYLKLNDKKQYVMTGMNIDKILPYQRKIFRNKAKFLRKTLNLLIIS